MLIAALSLLAGLVLLVAGAEALVRGASRLALAAGLSRLVVGLVIVSLGTSAPEVAISTGSAWQGKADLAIGNVLGSNVFNVLFILGLTALIAPLYVGHRLIRLDIPVMVGAAVVLAALSLDGSLDRLDGTVLAALAAGYVVTNLRMARSERFQMPEEQLSAARPADGRKSILASVVFVLVGLVGLVTGARLAVDGASTIALSLGASDLVVGLTVVAAGTGLPEAVTSVLATIRGERDIAIGNVVGSNILNVTLVLGLSSLVAPDALDVARGVLSFDLPIMIAVSLAILPVAFTGQYITRWEGGAFVTYYVAYVVFLVLTATVHPVVDEFRRAMLFFALPLTFIALIAAVWQEAQRRRGRSAG